MPPKPHHKSALWYGGGHWHKTAQAVAEIIALEKGYRSIDARAYKFTHSIPDVVIRKKEKFHDGAKRPAYWVTYAIEIVASHAPTNNLSDLITGIEDVLLIRRSDMQNPDSLKELFTLAKKVIP